MLITRCPSCSITFRIRPEQLGLRGGRVRCGNCQTAFSALSSLEEMPDEEADVTTIQKPAEPPAPAPVVTTPVAQPTPSPAQPPAQPTTPPAHIVAAPPPMRRATPDVQIGIQPPTQPRSAVSSAVAFAASMTESTPVDDDAIRQALDATLLNSHSTPTHRVGFSVDTHGIDVEEGIDIDIDLSEEPELDPSPEFEIPEFESFEPPAASAKPVVAAAPAASAPPAAPAPSVAPAAPALAAAPRPPARGISPVRQEPRFEIPLDDEVIELGAAHEDDPVTEILRKDSDVQDEVAEEIEPEDDPAPHFVASPAAEPEQRSRWPWTFASVFLMLVAATQVIYLFRTEIARWQPALRAPMENVCATFDCTVPYPRSADDVEVQGTDLTPEPGENGQFRLIVTLRNRAEYAQQWPHVELTLTDRFDRALARKVFTPAEWLPPELKSSPAFSAGEEVTAQVPLTAKDLPAAGFRVYVFHP